MKILQTSLICFIAATLSGCATGYYQRGYSGYNTGYSQRYYDTYDRDYYRPNTGFGFGQYYVQPNYRQEHQEHRPYQERRHDWQPPVPRFDHRDGGRGANGWQERSMEREQMQNQHHGEHPQQSPDNFLPHHQQQAPQQQERHSVENRGNSERGGQQHQGRHHGASE